MGAKDPYLLRNLREGHTDDIPLAWDGTASGHDCTRPSHRQVKFFEVESWQVRCLSCCKTVKRGTHLEAFRPKALLVSFNQLGTSLRFRACNGQTYSSDARAKTQKGNVGLQFTIHVSFVKDTRSKL